MKEVVLCKYGEIVLKGANRSVFEAKLVQDFPLFFWIPQIRLYVLRWNPCPAKREARPVPV